MVIAVKQAEAANLDFASIFAYQYVVGPRGKSIAGMDQLEIADVTVNVGRKLHRAVLLDGQGRLFGHILGIAVAPNGLINGEVSVDTLNLDDPAVFDRLAEYLNDVAGRYVLICAAGQEKRLYTDPVAMIGCCVNAKDRLAGSSLGLVLERDVIPHPKYDHEAVRSRGAKYAFFHTYDAHVTRLNGSFYLDLANFADYRFWPREEHFERPQSEYGAIYDEIIAASRHNMKEIIAHFPTSLPISGGSDSRLLVAFAGESLKDVTQCYTHITNYSTRYDNAVATLIAQQQNVAHETHSWRAPAPPPRSRVAYRKDYRSFMTAAGAPVGLPDELRRNVHQFLGKDHVVLRGHLTDLLRAVFVFTTKRQRWKDLDWQMQRLFPVPMAEFTPDVFERFRPDFVAWHRTLPAAAREHPVDFMFIEMYYNATVGFTFNGFHEQFYMSPFNSRRLIELSLAINVDYRRTIGPVDDIIYRIDRGLCEIPYYKEAGADLAALAPEAPWKEISKARMAAVRARYDNNYADI